MHIVLIYSGGLDSTVLLHHLLAEQHRVDALSVNYGQRHTREIQAARALTAAAGVRHEVADIRGAASLLAGNSLTDTHIAVPMGHYTESSMRATVVPNRNMILLALAIGWAVSQKADAVAYAAHAGDHTIYPDCRESFAQAMDRAARLADWREIRLLRPFIGLTKTELVARGTELGVPLAQTWSCYEGGSRHCGQCGTCIERREAFYLAGVTDATPYAPDAPATATLVRQQWKLTPC